jgi:transcriptional regulator with XRE-family HTH domain
MCSRRKRLHGERATSSLKCTLGVSYRSVGALIIAAGLHNARCAVHTGGMTTLRVVGHEPLTEAVARRLRGLLAELRISQKDFGAKTGWGRAYVYRRLTGETPMDTADLEHIQDATGIQVLYLVGETGPRYQPPTGGASKRNPRDAQPGDGYSYAVRPALAIAA